MLRLLLRITLQYLRACRHAAHDRRVAAAIVRRRRALLSLALARAVSVGMNAHININAYVEPREEIALP